MNSNTELVNYLKDSKVLETSNIIKAFENINRKEFVGKTNQDNAYVDSPLKISTESTISQPTTVAFMLELLQPQEGDEVLDVGAGSGWTTSLLAYMVGDKGKVIGTDIDINMVDFGRKNMLKYNFNNAEIIYHNGLEFEDKSFDKILVSAAVEKESQQLINLLNINGSMVIPIQNSVCKIIKTDYNDYDKECHNGFVFMPLVY